MLAVLHGGSIAAQTLGGGVDARHVTDEPDPAVAVRDEVGDAVARTAEAVGEDDVRVDLSGGAVHEDRGDTRLYLGLQIAVVVTGRDDHEPVHTACAQREDQLLLAVRVLGAGAVDQQGAVGAGHFLDRPAQRTVERVRQILQYESDARRTPLAEHPRAVVAPEAQRVDRLLYAALGVGGDSWLAVDYTRYRLQTDPGTRRDVLHRGTVAVAALGSAGGLGHDALSCPVVHGAASVLRMLGWSPDRGVASSIEPGQRCQMRERLSIAISGPPFVTARPACPFLMVQIGSKREIRH